MPRPPFQPTAQQRQMVETMAGVGVPQDDIALVVGIAKHTLTKHFGDELAVGKAKANAKVARGLFRTATDWMNEPGGKADRPAVVAMIYWTKTQMGWREKHDVTLSGPDGGPIQHEHSGGVVLYLPDNGRGDAGPIGGAAAAAVAEAVTSVIDADDEDGE